MANLYIGLASLIAFCALLYFFSRKALVKPAGAIFFALLLFSVGLVIGVPGAPLPIGGDYNLFSTWGTEIENSFESGETYQGRRIWPGKGIWPAIIASIFWIFGQNHFVVLALSAFVTGMVVITLQLATRLLTGRDPYFAIVLLLASSAALILNGSLLLREPFFWLGISVGLVGLGYFHRKEYWRSLVSTFLSGLLLILFRPDLGVVVFWGLLGLNVLGWIDQQKEIRWRVLVTAVLAMSALFSTLVPVNSALSEKNPSEKVEIYSEANGRDRVESAFKSNGTQSAASTLDRSNLEPENGVIGTIFRNLDNNWTHAFFGPFPWELRNSPVWYLAFSSLIHFWGTAFFFLVGMKNRGNYRLQNAGLFFVLLGLMILFSATMTNYGALSRFRIIVELLMSPLALSGMHSFSRKTRAQSR